MQKVALLDSRENAVHTPHFREKYIKLPEVYSGSGRRPKNTSVSLGINGNVMDRFNKFTSLKIYGSVSKPCTPGEHQNSW